MLLTDLPKNQVFSELDMRQIQRTCEFFGGGDQSRAPRIYLEDANLVTLDLFFGYKFSVSREMRQSERKFKNLRGEYTESYSADGFRVSVFMEGDELGQEWFATTEAMLSHLFGVMAYHVATNIGESEARIMYDATHQ